MSENFKISECVGRLKPILTHLLTLNQKLKHLKAIKIEIYKNCLIFFFLGFPKQVYNWRIILGEKSGEEKIFKNLTR